jgi:thimet oligopeptidase
MKPQNIRLWVCLFGVLSVGGVLGCTQAKTKADINMKGHDLSLNMIRSEYQAGEVTRSCEMAIQKAESALNALVSEPQKESSRSTLLLFEKILADLGDETAPLTFMGYVSTSSAINTEGAGCAGKIGDFMVKVFTRRDLYESIKKSNAKNSDTRRLKSETLKAFEKNGLKLPDAKLATVRQWMQELNQKEVEFSKNLAQDTSSVHFTKEDLEGVPDQFLVRLERISDGKFNVTTKSTDFTQVMENASNAETRRKILLAYMNRSAEKNTILLEEAIVLRHKIANAIGFANWADYQTQDRMALNSKNVWSFLRDLKSKLAERNKKDLDDLLKLKIEGDPKARTLDQWDIPYYANQLKKRHYHLDDEKVREYFPANAVIAGMFEVYSKILGLKFVEVKDAKTWADGVQLYEIRDVTKNSGDHTVGYFYTDFLPRPLKYGHAAAFSLISGRSKDDGAYSKPVSAIVANMNPPSKDIPSLLNHREVVTLFHEFGHIMHQTLTKAPYASLSGSSVARDFVEAPSQMLENWVWSPEVLTLLSGHYLDSKKKLPPEMLKKLIDARDFNQGYFYSRQLYFALMDMTYHTSEEKLDTVAIADRLFEEMFGVKPIQEGHFPATFGHLMGGYDAGYYGYLWSEVYAADMFGHFESQGILNSKTGAKYRKYILEQGNMQPAAELLEEFLGRKPNNKAFLKKLHI